MKKVTLPHGKFALVDAEDFHFINRFSWSLSAGYPNNGRLGRMHRFIMGYPQATVDHINGDPLDNRKSNLRVCTQAENVRNKAVMAKNLSKYKGVFARFTGRGWRFDASITVDRKKIHIGTYLSAKQAAIAYNEAAKSWHCAFARLNKL